MKCGAFAGFRRRAIIALSPESKSICTGRCQKGPIDPPAVPAICYAAKVAPARYGEAVSSQKEKLRMGLTKKQTIELVAPPTDRPVRIERNVPPVVSLPNEVVGIKEIMPLVGVCERHLRELVKRGVIPVIRLPYTSKLLFHVPTVRAAVLRYQTGAGAGLVESHS